MIMGLRTSMKIHNHLVDFHGWVGMSPSQSLRSAGPRSGMAGAGLFAVAALCCAASHRAAVSLVPRASSLRALLAQRCGGLPLPSLTRNTACDPAGVTAICICPLRRHSTLKGSQGAPGPGHPLQVLAGLPAPGFPVRALKLTRASILAMVATAGLDRRRNNAHQRVSSNYHAQRASI